MNLPLSVDPQYPRITMRFLQVMAGHSVGDGIEFCVRRWQLSRLSLLPSGEWTECTSWPFDHALPHRGEGLQDRTVTGVSSWERPVTVRSTSRVSRLVHAFHYRTWLFNLILLIRCRGFGCGSFWDMNVPIWKSLSARSYMWSLFLEPRSLHKMPPGGGRLIRTSWWLDRFKS